MFGWVDGDEFLERFILYVAYIIVSVWKLIVWQYSYPATTGFLLGIL